MLTIASSGAESTHMSVSDTCLRSSCVFPNVLNRAFRLNQACLGCQTKVEEGLSGINQLQSLRNVIPAQIGQFISLFKDTTLAGAALSMLELLKIGEAITKQDDYLGQGLVYESLGFVALLFWVGSYVMSRESQRLERKLGVGIR